MAIHWDPNPIAISIESIHCNIYWYGILFATGFILGYLLAKYMCKKENLPTEKLDALLKVIETNHTPGTLDAGNPEINQLWTWYREEAAKIRNEQEASLRRRSK